MKHFTDNPLFKMYAQPTQELDKIYVTPNYAVSTLINGNISACIEYLQNLLTTGLTGIKIVHEELSQIKEQCPERYSYVIDKVFTF